MTVQGSSVAATACPAPPVPAVTPPPAPGSVSPSVLRVWIRWVLGGSPKVGPPEIDDGDLEQGHIPAPAATTATEDPAHQPSKDTPPAAAETTTSCLGRLLVMYSDALDKYPVVTKSTSSGLIGLLGDVLAQSIGWVLWGGPPLWATPDALWRSCAVMLDGFFINGPLLHYAYEILEEYLPAEESLLAAVIQVGVDVFVIDPVFAFIFVWSTGLIEGRSVRHEILGTLEHDYPTMVLWLVVIGLCWAPLQIYLFNRYPVQFRVLTADLIDLVWTCVTSFFCHV